MSEGVGCDVAIRIVAMHSPSARGYRATVDYAGQILDAEVVLPEALVRDCVGVALPAEVGYDHVLTWRLVPLAAERPAGIFPGGVSGVARLVGIVHNRVELDGDEVLYDVYCQVGPEFVVFSSLELGDRYLGRGTRLEAHLTGLRFYPIAHALPRLASPTLRAVAGRRT